MGMEKSRHCVNCPLREQPGILQQYAYKPDILFVGGFPVDTDIKRGPFSGRSSSLLRLLVRELRREFDSMNENALRLDYAYACQCAPVYDEALRKFNITAETIQHCSLILKQRIDHTHPKVIVALGGDALKGLGFKMQPRDMRGGIYNFESNGVKIPVVVTFHIVAVNKSPGYLQTFKKDLHKALSLCRGSVNEIQMDIRTPTTVDEILAQLDEILVAAKEHRERTGKFLGVAVDTETTSLQPYLKNERVIMVSMSHKRGEGLAYPFEHVQCPFSAEDFARIRNKTEEVLSSENISILMANGKFDMQWLHYHYGINMRPMQYDVILAEHVLDEDKKGEYSLKDLTRDRFPSMGKYEDELKQHLKECWGAKDAEIARLTEAHRAATDKAVVDWWVSLSEDERKAVYSTWIEQGWMQLTDIEPLVKVRYRKLHGEMTIPKKYSDALGRLIRQVPKEELAKHMTLPELVIPEELHRGTYEDADLKILLRYAAIDALTTRMITADQQGDFAADRNRMAMTQRKWGRPIPTRLCSEVMFDNTIPLCRCLAEMEYYGVKLDRDKCARYRDIITEKIAEAEDVMFTEVGRKFNTSSSAPDLGRILYDELHLPVLKRTDTGAPSTDADTIKELLDKHDVPFLKKLLVYRKLDKCLHTYIENWLNISAYDGNIHAAFNQIGTSTYRLSSNGPNLQNVPYQLKEANLNLKELFIPDSDAYNVYDLDLSNAEMRILTAYSKDEELINAFNNGKDLHCLTAAGISQYTYDDIKAHKEDKTTDQYLKRQLAKKVNFGSC